MSRKSVMPNVDLQWLKDNEVAIAFVNGKLFAIIRTGAGEWVVRRSAYRQDDKEGVFVDRDNYILHKVQSSDLTHPALPQILQWLSANRRKVA